MTPRSLEEVASPAIEESASAHQSLSPPASTAAECVTAPAPSSDSNQIPGNAYPLVLRGLHKRWHKDQPPVLDGLDLTLDLGTRTWVGGRNGAGKTTLLRIAAGLIDPDRGRAEVWGYTARENRVRYQQVMSFLPAGDRGLYARLTVRRQLDFWARIAMIKPALVSSVVSEAIDTFELGELADRRVDRLSMGQRQRLRIAMTFLPSPEVVLLDEPLTSLDAEGAAVLNRAIEDTIARHGAVLWCSPSGEQLEQVFDARWMLEDGRLSRV